VAIIQSCLEAQDSMKASMAVRLEDLTRHYDQMAKALGESKTGTGTDIFIEEDIKGKFLLFVDYMGNSKIYS
jgi:autophagy-related protein 17